jgi:hypothetical protein
VWIPRVVSGTSVIRPTIEVRGVEKMLAVAKGAATARCKAEQKLTAGVMR